MIAPVNWCYRRWWRESGCCLVEALLTLGVGAWVGGFVTVLVVSRSSSASLEPPQRVRLFRDFGRRYGIVAAVAMAFILFPAAILSYINPLNTPALAILVLSVVIIAISIPAIRQARRIGALRRDALDHPNDKAKADAVARGVRSGTIMRSILAVGSVGLVVLTVIL